MNTLKKRLNMKQLSMVSFSLLLACYFTAVVNLPILAELHHILSALQSVKIGFILSIPIFFIAAFNFIFSLFSWPLIARPFFMVLVIVSSIVSYAMYNYGVLIDYGMIENIAETDTSEASSYLSSYSVLWILLMGGGPALLISKVKFTPIGSKTKLLVTKSVSMGLSLIVIAIIALLYYKDYSSVGRNNSYLNKMIIPTHLMYSATKYINKTYFAAPIEYRKIGLDAKQSPKSVAAEKPTLMVFILGETARSQNQELNGYSRSTNRYTRGKNIISFHDVSSCGTATAVSVPCMYSQLPKRDYDKRLANHQDNFLDIMKRAGISLLWKDNDSGDKGVAKNITYQEIKRNIKSKYCNGNTCYDMALLENFDSDVRSLEGNRMLSLHLIGSHGPTYFQRYPDEHRIFTPDCPRSDIENCNLDEIINTYDNTILYSDYVISQTIEKLEKLESEFNTALFYISDHGESMGENGLFLHGTPYKLAPDFQTKVPMMVWMSEDFKQAKNIDSKCLNQAAQQRSYSQDNVFHSMLGIMDVDTKVYQPELDLFSSCRT